MPFGVALFLDVESDRAGSTRLARLSLVDFPPVTELREWTLD